MKTILIITSLLLASCSKNYYVPVQSTEMATVSFSNLSPELPEISIINNCRKSYINNKYIENKNPNDKARIKISIPANTVISFNYNYVWFGAEKNSLVTKSNNYINHIETKTTKDMENCNNAVTFTPENNKHYEVYFGKNSNHCIIKASEVYIEPKTSTKHLIKIETSSQIKC